MTRFDAALKYVALGWAVLPLHTLRNGRCSCGRYPCGPENRTAGKHPFTDLVRHGVHDASKEVEQVREWFTRVPDANIGIATGAPSGFDVLDVDPRNGSDDTLSALQKQHGALPDTAMQLTGGGGYHYLFKHAGHRLKSPGRGLDVKSTGGYIIVEPSTHASGGIYAWEGSADPTEGHPIADAPQWMQAPATLKPSGHSGTGYLDPQRIADLRAALVHLDASDYTAWIQVGQALHSTGAPEAFELWDTWSQQASNYDNTTAAKWRTFRADGPLHVESIFAWARDAGWDGHSPRASQPVPLAHIARHRLDAVTVPPHLLTIPGALGDVVDYANRTAPQPQPQFAVQAALAFGATVMGRHVRTTGDNYTSLYFINVGKSSGGKEHGRTVLEACLEAANLGALIGPTGYNSGSAVMSALLHKPSHVAIIDEIGRSLATASAEGNYHRHDALTALMSVWGQCNGTVRAAGYSTMSKTAAEREQLEDRKVVHPAITLLGMSTPKAFYSALTEASIESGFLGRFLVVESHLPRAVPARVTPMDVPASVVQWAETVRIGAATGNLVGVRTGPEQAPVPRAATITAEAWHLFDQYGAECVKAQDALEQHGWAELEGRSREQAMRVAAIVAGSLDPMRCDVTAECARWAIDYVREAKRGLIASVRKHMHGSKFGALYQHVLERIQGAGERGMTDRDLAKFSAQFRGLDTRQRKEVLAALRQDGLIAEVELTSASGRGRKRVAWVACETEGEEAAA